MGKLAQRFEDAAKSGVYRVSSAAIPLEAAAQANARVFELGVDEVQALAARLRDAQEDRRPCVVLIEEGAQHAWTQGRRYALLLDELHELARQCRAKALPFFALLVDPAASLDLPELYKERSKPGTQ